MEAERTLGGCLLSGQGSQEPRLSYLLCCDLGRVLRLPLPALPAGLALPSLLCGPAQATRPWKRGSQLNSSGTVSRAPEDRGREVPQRLQSPSSRKEDGNLGGLGEPEIQQPFHTLPVNYQIDFRSQSPGGPKNQSPPLPSSLLRLRSYS